MATLTRLLPSTRSTSPRRSVLRSCSRSVAGDALCEWPGSVKYAASHLPNDFNTASPVGVSRQQHAVDAAVLSTKGIAVPQPGKIP